MEKGVEQGLFHHNLKKRFVLFIPNLDIRREKKRCRFVSWKKEKQLAVCAIWIESRRRHLVTSRTTTY